MAAKKRPSYLSPFAYARRKGLYEGVLGGNRTWLAVGGSVWALRAVRRTLGKTEQVVATEKLLPGQIISLEAIGPNDPRHPKGPRPRRK